MYWPDAAEARSAMPSLEEIQRALAARLTQARDDIAQPSPILKSFDERDSSKVEKRFYANASRRLVGCCREPKLHWLTAFNCLRVSLLLRITRKGPMPFAGMR